MVVTQLLRSKELYRNSPLLHYARNLFPIDVLKDSVLICAQHLVSTTYTMFHHLFELGLEPENLFVLGKCYSTDERVYKQLIREGVQVSPFSTYFDSYESYDERYQWNISQFFNDSIKKLRNSKKLLFLDDGGYLLRLANQTLPDGVSVRGVEQTTAGARLLKNSSLSFPVVNVARSRTKLNYESPLIARLVCDRLSHLFHGLLHLSLKILIIGYGYIGKAIFRRLRGGERVSQIDIYDPHKKGSSFPESELNKYIGDYDIIIGCSGTTTLSDKNYPYLKRPVYLVSASSSDREFDAVKLRYAHRQVFDPHTSLNINEIHLMNCGFPYPFDSCYDVIDLIEFQLTRSLLLSAVAQASTLDLKKPGLISLSTNLQSSIIKKHFELKDIK